jgi:hypothetical protein
MSIEDELLAEVMAILKDEEPSVAVMVAARTVIECMRIAGEQGHQHGAFERIKQAIELADRLKLDRQ